MLPKPSAIHKAVPVALNDIVERVEINKQPIPLRDDLWAPEDRCHEEAYLHDDADQLLEVAEKDHHCGGQKGYASDEDNGGAQVVGHLQDVKAEAVPGG